MRPRTLVLVVRGLLAIGSGGRVFQAQGHRPRAHGAAGRRRGGGEPNVFRMYRGALELPLRRILFHR